MDSILNTRLPHMFASDNTSSVHPEVMQALQSVNVGHAVSYGDDPYTRRAEAMMCDLMGRKVALHFVLNGTGANVLSLASVSPAFGGVICADTAHIHTDEGGALERMTGLKIYAVPNDEGKVRPHTLDAYLKLRGNMHHNQPCVLSITQITELGTLYTLDELRALCAYAHQNGLLVHMDGARIANAAAALNCSLAATTLEAGVDILSFGGMKNGLMFGEAVVFADTALAANMPYHRKQQSQLMSKMRYIAAQYIALMTDDLYLKSARRANEVARVLRDGLTALPGVSLAWPSAANEMFVRMPAAIIDEMQKECFFYIWDDAAHIVRLVASHDNTEAEARAFVETCRKLIASR